MKYYLVKDNRFYYTENPYDPGNYFWGYRQDATPFNTPEYAEIVLRLRIGEMNAKVVSEHHAKLKDEGNLYETH